MGETAPDSISVISFYLMGYYEVSYLASTFIIHHLVIIKYSDETLLFNHDGCVAFLLSPPIICMCAGNNNNVWVCVCVSILPF